MVGKARKGGLRAPGAESKRGEAQITETGRASQDREGNPPTDERGSLPFRPTSIFSTRYLSSMPSCSDYNTNIEL